MGVVMEIQIAIQIQRLTVGSRTWSMSSHVMDARIQYQGSAETEASPNLQIQEERPDLTMWT